MPTIPTYESRLGVSRGVSPYRLNTRTFMPFVRGANQIGDALQKRGEQLIEEHDTTRSMGAYNRLRDESRSKVSELLQREGASAQGVQTEYEEWHKKTIGNITGSDLTVSKQRDMFAEMAEKRRQSDLDQLATHEAQQHQAYKKEVVSGMGEALEIDIRAKAFDDAAQDEMIDNYFGQLDRLYPGHDLTTVKAEALQRLRFTTAQELVDQNPEYAETWIDSHKQELGEKYYTLKEGLKAKGKQTRVDSAIAVLQTAHGTNHETAMSQVAVQSNWKKYGIKNNDEAEEVMHYFRSMVNDRDRSAAKVERDKEKHIGDIESQLMLEKYDPDTPKTLDIHKEMQGGNVSTSFYVSYNRPESAEAIIDHLDTVDEIHTATVAGDYDRAKRLIVYAAEIDKTIKPSTAVNMIKRVTDVRQARAAKLLIQALKPGQFDKYFMDKNLKLAEAFEQFYEITTATGRAPESVARDLVQGYTKHVLRSADNIITPKLLITSGMTVREAKVNPEKLQAAKEATAAYLKAGRMTPEEYRVEMNAIEQLEEIARRYEEPQEVDEELQTILEQSRAD